MDGVIRRRIILFLLASVVWVPARQRIGQGPFRRNGRCVTNQSESGEGLPLSGFFKPGNLGLLTVPGENSKGALSIRSVDVRVEVEGRLARTVVEQVFRNHTARQTEGTYSLHYPRGIHCIRNGLEGKMMEEVGRARTRAQDLRTDCQKAERSALLSGGRFVQTQIFPIPANGDKRVILARANSTDVERTLSIAMGCRALKVRLKAASWQLYVYDATASRAVKAERYAFQQTQRRGVTELRYAAKGFVQWVQSMSGWRCQVGHTACLCTAWSGISFCSTIGQTYPR